MKKSSQNRREFLRKSGLIGSAFFLGNTFPYIDDHTSGNEVLQVGVIGTGSRGKGLIKIIEKIPYLKVAACCDILSFRLDECKKITDSDIKYFQDYRSLLDDITLDAVIISTPLFAHYEIALAALDAGKHVYCEKTMTYDSRQANLIVQKTRESKELIFQVGYQYRSSKLYQGIVEMVQNGSIGTVTGISCQWNRNGDWRRNAPNVHSEKMVNWRMYNDYSRGLLGELSSHQIDFVNWITGNNAIKVVATGGIDYWKDGRETNDNVHAVYDYPNGVKATFTCRTANAYNGYQILILGDRATILLNQDIAYIYPEATFKDYGNLDGVTGATIASEIQEIPIKIPSIEPTHLSLRNFTKSIRENGTAICAAEAGRNATIAVEMASTAIKENRSVVWDEFN